MDASEFAQQVARLTKIEQSLAAELLQLDGEPTFTLLSASPLSGRTGERVNHLIAAAPGLWLLLGALDGHIDRLETLEPGGAWRNGDDAEIRHLLEGQSLVVPVASMDEETVSVLAQFGQRDDLSIVVTADAVIAAFRSLFERVRAAVDEVDHVWADLMPLIDASTRSLTHGDAVSARLGVNVAQLKIARQRLEAVRSMVSDDPLAMTTSVGDSLERIVDEAMDEVESLERAHDSLGDKLGAMQRVLADLRVVRARAAAAYSEAAAKVVGADLTRIPGPGVIDGAKGLAHRAAQLQDVAGRPETEWQSIRVEVERWHTSATLLAAQLERGLATNRGPLATRDELRGRFTAYKIKATGLARLSGTNEAIEDLISDLHEELYRNPTDLAKAQTLLQQLSTTM